LIICCSCVSCGGIRIDGGREGYDSPVYGNGEEEDSGYPEFDPETAVFDPLPVCRGGDVSSYVGQNSVVTVSDVVKTPNKFRMYVRVNDAGRVFSNLELSFFVGDRVERYCIHTAVPLVSYEILIARNGSDSFWPMSAKWDPIEKEIGRDYSFGKNIWMDGKVTMRYFSMKDIMVFNADGCVIGEYSLRGIGSIVLNQGADYYKVVK